MTLKRKLFSAYFWQLLGKWVVRSIGIVSTLVLARLLEPSDFGILAIALMCMGLFEQFTNFGIDRYLVMKTELTSKLLNSCWTLNILLRLALISLVVAFAGSIADYVNTPEIELVLSVVALGSFFSALNNIGLIRLQRKLNFKPLTLLSVISKLLATLITLLLAWLYPGYWALVFGSMSMAVIYMIGSYFAAPHRPAINLRFERAMFSFSFYMLLRGLIGYTRNKMDTLLVGRLFDSGSVGKYSIGLDFAVLPQMEVVAPATGAMFPGLAQFKHDRPQLFDKTYKFLALVYLLILPSIIGVQVIADQFCLVILGEKWADTGPIMAALAFMMLPYSFTSQMNNLFDYLGKARWSLFSDLIGIGLLLAAFISFKFENVAEFAEIRAEVGVMAFILVILYSKMIINLSLTRMMEILIPPLLGSVAMWGFFHFIYAAQDLTMAGIMINMVVGVLIYVAAMAGILFTLKSHSSIWAFWWDYLRENLQRLFCKPPKNGASISG